MSANDDDRESVSSLVIKVWLLGGGAFALLKYAGICINSMTISKVDNLVGGVWVTSKLFDMCLNFLLFLMVGWGLAMGKDDGGMFGGSSQFFCIGLNSDSGGWTAFFLLYMISAIFLVIVTEVMRSSLIPLHVPYQAITLLLIAVIFPILVHWGWSDHGWASAYRSTNPDGLLLGCGLLDVNGSSIIHLAGSLCGMAFDYAVTTDMTWLQDFVANEIGLQTDNDHVFLQKLQHLKRSVHGMYQHSLAVFIIWIGTYGLIVINMPVDSDNAADNVGVRVINVTMAAVCACIMGVIVHASGISHKFNCQALTLEAAEKEKVNWKGPKEDDNSANSSKIKEGEFNPGKIIDHHQSTAILSGIYTALVSISGSCATCEVGGAAAIGCIAVLFNAYIQKLVHYIGIPHRSSTYSVHLTGGLWGLLAPGLFTSQRNYAVLMGTAFSATDLGGIANKGRFYTTYDSATETIDLTVTTRSEFCAGAFYGGSGAQLGANVLFGLALLVWCVVPVYIAVKVMMVMFPDDFTVSNIGKIVEEQQREELDRIRDEGPASRLYNIIFGKKTQARHSVRAMLSPRSDAAARAMHHAMDNETLKLDEKFEETYGYSWDAVMVLPLHPDIVAHRDAMFKLSHQASKPTNGSMLVNSLAHSLAKHDAYEVIDAKYPSARDIIKAMRRKGLETHQFYSAIHDKIFVKVRAPLHVLRRHADYMDLPMELDPEEVRKECNKKFEEVVDGKLVIIEPFEIYDGKGEKITDIGPYDHIYAKMDDTTFTCMPNVYKKYPGYNHCFGPTNRLRVIDSLVKSALVFTRGENDSDSDDTENDATNIVQIEGNEDECAFKQEYTFDYLVSPRVKAIKAWFPLHDDVEIERLNSRVFNFSVMPGSEEEEADKTIQDLIKNYLGEEIALYFKFLTHYVVYLAPIAVLGSASTLNVLLLWLQNGDYFDAINAAWSVPIFSLIVCLWALVFIRTWATKERYYSMRWGTTDFEETEAELPSYSGKKKRSYIDGSFVKIVNRQEQNSRSRVSSLVITSLSVLVMGVIAVTFYFKYWLITNNMEDYSVLADVINALSIAVLDVVYNELAMKMTHYENHRTQTSFNDSMITKLFLFSFANSYAPAIYIAFLKRAIGDACLANSCMGELGRSMAVIFTARSVGQHVTTYIAPRIPVWYEAARKALTDLNARISAFILREALGVNEEEVEGSNYTGGNVSLSEKQFIRPKFDNVFSDYNELSVQFGFLCLFSAAFPIAPLLAIINNFIEVRSDGSKMLDAFRRPWPAGAEDIGSWYPIFQIIGALSIISNAGILSWTMDLLGEDMSSYSRLAIFIIFVLINFFLRQIMSQMSFSKRDEEVDIQLARQAHIVRKLIDRVPDEVEYQDHGNRSMKYYSNKNTGIFDSEHNIQIVSADRQEEYDKSA